MRSKVRVNWHQLLKADQVAEENGFHNRLFRQTEVYQFDFAWWDYPRRSNCKWSSSNSWKNDKRRKHQYKVK